MGKLKSMPIRFFLKFLFINCLVLLSLSLFNPKPALAQQACSSCNTQFSICHSACAPAPPFSIACNLACDTARALCFNGAGPIPACIPDTSNPAELGQYCANHPNDNVCRAVNTNGVPCSPSNGGNGVDTAIGCVPTDFNNFIPSLLTFAYIIGGTIALIMMVIGAFQMITSGGNPESIKKGREQFIAAASGLVFIVLSTALLRIIGIDILGIPGF